MGSGRLELLGVGNAIVDVLAHTDDDFLIRNDLVKSAMTLIDEAQAKELYDQMGTAVEMSGGSVANSVAAVASMGIRSAFVGKVRDDQLGEVFRHDLQATGVEFETPAADQGPATARSYILITPDGQRTMNTYLGACVGLSAEDIDEKQVADADILYLEGYLWDAPSAKDAFLKAMDVAKSAGNKVAFTLSDQFLVERYKSDLLHLAEHYVDILFANEREVMALYDVDEFDDAFQQVRAHCEIAALTRSARGSVVISQDEIHIVDPEPAEVVDATGAGDLYAAGFLYGLCCSYDLFECGQLGSILSADVITHVGARTGTDLKALAKRKLGH